MNIDYKVLGVSDRNFYAVTAIEMGMVDRGEGIACLEDRLGVSYSDILRFLAMTSESFDSELLKLMHEQKVIETLYLISAPSDLDAYMFHKGIANRKVKSSSRLTSRPYFNGDLIVYEKDERIRVIVPAGLGVRVYKVKKSVLRV